VPTGLPGILLRFLAGIVTAVAVQLATLAAIAFLGV
jgi:hypothetical protein